MNDLRRKSIKKVIAMITEAKDTLELIKDDEEDYYDNIPDNLIMSTRAMASSDAISSMEDAIEEMENAISELEEVF